MTSATERLRALLDEREVEWRVGDYPTTCTVWESDGIVWHGLWRDGCIELIAWQVTPEQAVEATLGRGTCRALDGESSSGAPLQAGDYDEFWEPAGVCSECGELIPLRNYCPNCGRKVVE